MLVFLIKQTGEYKKDFFKLFFKPDFELIYNNLIKNLKQNRKIVMPQKQCKIVFFLTAVRNLKHCT